MKIGTGISISSVWPAPGGGSSDTTAPAAPTGLTATPGDSTVALDWSDNAEGDLDHYKVYRSTSSGFTPGAGNLLADDVAVSEYTDNTAVNGTMYYYVVAAVDTSDNESDPSSEVNAAFYFLDTFTEATNTLLPDHTPDVDTVGGGWTSNAGQGTIDAAQDAVYGLCNSWIDVGVADGTVTARVRLDSRASSISRASIYVRNGGSSLSGYVIGLFGTGSDALLAIKLASDLSTLDSEVVSGSISDDTFYDLTITLNGTSISATLEGFTVTYTDATFTSNTNIGIYSRLSGDAVDDLQFTS